MFCKVFSFCYGADTKLFHVLWKEVTSMDHSDPILKAIHQLRCHRVGKSMYMPTYMWAFTHTPGRRLPILSLKNFSRVFRFLQSDKFQPLNENLGIFTELTFKELSRLFSCGNISPVPCTEMACSRLQLLLFTFWNPGSCWIQGSETRWSITNRKMWNPFQRLDIEMHAWHSPLHELISGKWKQLAMNRGKFLFKIWNPLHSREQLCEVICGVLTRLHYQEWISGRGSVQLYLTSPGVGSVQEVMNSRKKKLISRMRMWSLSPAEPWTVGQWLWIIL